MSDEATQKRRTDGAIRHQLKQVKYRHLKKRIRAALAQVPVNCAYNHMLADNDHGSVRVCTYRITSPEEESGLAICDERIQPCPAGHCGWFQHREPDPDAVKAAVKAEFEEFFETASLPEVLYAFPDVGSLLWVLTLNPEMEPTGASLPAVREPPGLPFWRRWFSWVPGVGE